MYSAFLTYLYSPCHQKIVEALRNLLDNLDLKLIDGKHFKSTAEITWEVQKTIQYCDMSIAIFTGSEKDDYLFHETSFAAECGKPVIIVADRLDRVTVPDTARADIYTISFEDGEIRAAAKVVAAVNCIKSKLNLRKEDSLDKQFLVEEIDKEQWHPDILKSLQDIRNLFDSLDYERALQKAQQIYSIYPECWRAGIANSAALIFLQRFSEAESVLDKTIQVFSGNPRALSHAYQNKSWLIYTKFSLLGNLSAEKVLEIIYCFQLSLKYEPRSIVYIDLMVLLLQINRVQEAETLLFDCLNHFPNAKQEFHRQLQIRGADFLQAIAKSSTFMKILFPKG